MPGDDRPLRRDISDTPPPCLGAHKGQPDRPDSSDEGSTPVQASGGVFQSTSPNSPPHGSIHGESPQVFNYGPIHNIGTAGNVWTGPNYGSVTMHSESDGFTVNLAGRLKISVKADHRYYACGDENALHRSSCTPGTRVAIIEFIILWATEMAYGSEPVY
ncbi:hypothetical protein BKA70DRAFT_1299250 [Coprinopsis sp. MPI-PUGE-AT-0042]|nr:hypothetical protein BKA70DRAFT_1299250 [Coprinopsis sp. MPI-PUGE-AT-0042]